MKDSLKQMYSIPSNSQNVHFVKNAYVPAPWKGKRDELNNVVVFDICYGADHTGKSISLKVGDKKVPITHFNSLGGGTNIAKSKREGLFGWIKKIF